MKKAYLLTFLFVLVMTFTQAQTNKTDVEKPIDLTYYMLSGETLMLTIGQKAKIGMSVHGSVDVTASVYAMDENIVKFVEATTEYKNEEWQKAEEEEVVEEYYVDEETGLLVVSAASDDYESGGDEAVKTYIFEAVHAGETIIYVEKGFRGEIESKHSIKINVIDK